MRYLALFFSLVTLHASPVCAASYSIYIAPQIPEYVTVNGPYGPEQWPNAERPDYPVSYGKEICRPDNYSPFAADPDRRKRVFTDYLGTATNSELFAACPQIRTVKEGEIRSGGSTRLTALANPYSAEERESWTQQQAEAKEFQADTDCECSLIRAMATNRGIPLPLLAGKILENAALFKTVSGQILGTQQQLLDRIAAETDFERLLAIAWSAP